MKRWLFILLVPLCVQLANADTTYVSGNVSGNWTPAGSPYIATGVLTIPSGSVLSILDGVTIKFQGPYRIDVFGQLLCFGTEDSIKFTQDTVGYPARWQGIRFLSPDSLSMLRYVIFENSSSYEGAVNLAQGTSVTITGNAFRDCRLCAFVARNTELRIGNSKFERCGLSGGCGGAIRAYNATGTVHAEFFNCGSLDGGAVCFYNCLLELNGCLFYENRATLWGGAVYADDSRLTFENCFFELNKGLTGGALHLNDSPETTFTRCGFTKNTGNRDGIAGRYGVGYMPTGLLYKFENCVFDSNSASNVSAFYAAVPCEFKECVFLSNIGGPLVSGAGISVTFSDFWPEPIVGRDAPQDIAELATVNTNGDSVDVYGNLVAPPEFVDLYAGFGPYYPYFLSPLIDAGDTTETDVHDGTFPEIGLQVYWHFPVVDDLTIQRLDDTDDIALRWTPSSTSCDYRIYRSAYDAWDWNTVEIVAETVDTFWVHQSALAEPAARYTYAVSSINCEAARLRR